jgi:hypothetical protein
MAKNISFIKTTIRNSWGNRTAYHLHIDGVPQFIKGRYLNGVEYNDTVAVSKKEMLDAIGVNNSIDEFPFIISNFTYNGFLGTKKKGTAPYTAKFNRWSGDPGIALMDCSDNKKRLIPSYAIHGSCLILRDENYNTGVLFGLPSNSQ